MGRKVMGQVSLFNFYYFLYIALAVGVTIISVKFLKNKTDRFRSRFIFGLIMLNFVIHFLKVMIYPYTLVDHVWTKVTFENICATSVLLFPLLYFVKNKTIKDYMVMVGMASGVITFIAPVDAMSSIFNGSISIGVRPAFLLENIRFYFAHYLLFLIPFLMMHYKMHEISIRRAYRAPFMLLLIFLVIFINELIITALGWVPKEHLFDPNKRNPSFIFGTKEEFTGIGMMVGALIPSFFVLTHPVYEFTFLMPVIWLILPTIVYGGMIALIFCFIYDKEDTKLFFKQVFNPRSIKSEESQKI
jgi:hypothetical protein